MSERGGGTETLVDHDACTMRSFVIQLRRDADPAAGIHRGRVQHLRTGASAHFDSLADLGEFVARAIGRGDQEKRSTGG